MTQTTDIIQKHDFYSKVVLKQLIFNKTEESTFCNKLTPRTGYGY